jgi:long-chain-fatty-acid---luciferin-component ligase
MVFPYEIERKASQKVVQELVATFGNPIWLNALSFGLEKAMANARWNPIDDWVYHPDPWHCSTEEIHRRQLETIRCAFLHHYSHCLEYHRICESQGVRPEDIKTREDFLKIPLLTSEFFKNNTILSVPEEDITLVLTTSGTTSQNPSRLPKDFLSVKRQHAVIDRVIAMYVTKMAHYLGYFAPPPNEATIWMSLVPFVPLQGYVVDYYMEGGKLSISDVFNRMKFAKSRSWTPGGLAAFHFFYKKLMDYTKETGQEPPLKGDDLEMVLTGGGWKNLKEEMISKDKFQIMLSDYFEVPYSRVRDAYGFGETNIVAFDCAYHNGMHVDPHTLVSIRDPKNVDEEVAPGEEGIIAVYDPTMNSFPAFVLSDDVGYIDDFHECECSANTQKIYLTGRAPKAELRSCGLKLMQTMDVISSPEMKNRFSRIDAKARYFDLTRI